MTMQNLPFYRCSLNSTATIFFNLIKAFCDTSLQKRENFQWWKYACFSSSFYGSFHLRNSFQWTPSAAIIINVTVLLRTSFLWVCVISDKIVTCVFKYGSLKRNTINRSKYFVITQGRNYYIWWTSIFLVLNHRDMFFAMIKTWLGRRK